MLRRFDDAAMALLEEVGLAEFAATPAGELSYGRKRALEIATTLALDPEMLLLDEPMAGMAQEDVGRISALIRRIAANRTILMVEHNLSVVAGLSDRITVLARGQVLAEGAYDAGVEGSARHRGLYRSRPWLRRDRSRRPTAADGRCSRCATSQGWYGESHVLHGINFDVSARARW